MSTALFYWLYLTGCKSQYRSQLLVASRQILPVEQSCTHRTETANLQLLHVTGETILTLFIELHPMRWGLFAFYATKLHHYTAYLQILHHTISHSLWSFCQKDEKRCRLIAWWRSLNLRGEKWVIHIDDDNRHCLCGRVFVRVGS